MLADLKFEYFIKTGGSLPQTVPGPQFGTQVAGVGAGTAQVVSMPGRTPSGKVGNVSRTPARPLALNTITKEGEEVVPLATIKGKDKRPLTAAEIGLMSGISGLVSMGLSKGVISALKEKNFKSWSNAKKGLVLGGTGLLTLGSLGGGLWAIKKSLEENKRRIKARESLRKNK